MTARLMLDELAARGVAVAVESGGVRVRGALAPDEEAWFGDPGNASAIASLVRLQELRAAESARAEEFRRAVMTPDKEPPYFRTARGLVPLTALTTAEVEVLAARGSLRPGEVEEWNRSRADKAWGSWW